MPEATKVQRGSAIDYTAGAALTAGDVIALGTLNSDNSLVGVTPNDAENGEVVGLEIEGVFDLTKSGGTGVTFSAGDKAYWDDVAKTSVAAAAADTALAGVVVADAADADTTVRVKINAR